MIQNQPAMSFNHNITNLYLKKKKKNYLKIRPFTLMSIGKITTIP